MGLIIISILIYIITGFFLTRIFFDSRPSGKGMLIGFLVAFACNVLVFEILNFFKLLNSPSAFLLGQIVLCAGLLISLIWIKKVPFRDLLKGVSNPFIGFRWLDFVFLGGIALILGGFFAVGITTPPNNVDSLTTHLPRIYYWLQHGSFADWQALSIPQIDYPINAHIQGMWLFLLGKQESLFFLVQWFSLVIINISVYQISRLLKFSISQALLSVLVLLSFPVFLLQTYSFQGDLTVTSLVVAGIYFTFDYLQTKKLSALIFALLAVALALGTKQTAFFVLPAFGGLLIYTLLVRKIEKPHIPLLSLLIVFFLLFSSYKYFQNLIETGYFFGESNITFNQKISIGNLAGKLQYNLPRYLYRFIGFDGIMGPAEKTLTEVKAQIVKPITTFFHLDLETEVYLQPGYDKGEVFSYTYNPPLAEDTSSFGPLCFLLLLIGVVFTAFSKEKNRREYLIFALGLNLSYIIIVILQRPGWDPYQVRYFILSTVPLVPLISSILPENGKAKIPIALAVFLATLFLAINSFLYNNNKPVITDPNIDQFRSDFVFQLPKETFLQRMVRSAFVRITNYQLDLALPRASIYDVNYEEQLLFNNLSLVREINLVSPVIPAEAPLYLLISRSSLEYALFGINKTRNLFPVMNLADVSQGGYVLVENVKVKLTTRFKLLASDKIYSVYLREE